MDEHIYKRHHRIGERYEIVFVEIGTDEDHIHFLIQSVPKMSVDRIVKMVKNITAREVCREYAMVKKELCGGNFRTNEDYANTAGQYVMQK